MLLGSVFGNRRLALAWHTLPEGMRCQCSRASCGGFCAGMHSKTSVTNLLLCTVCVAERRAVLSVPLSSAGRHLVGQQGIYYSLCSVLLMKRFRRFLWSFLALGNPPYCIGATIETPSRYALLTSLLNL